MANGLICGKVKNSKENAFMLDNGLWLATRHGEPSPAAGARVLVSYWTRNSQLNGSWKTFNNVIHCRRLDDQYDFRELQEQLTQFGIELDTVPYEQQARADRYEEYRGEEVPF